MSPLTSCVTGRGLAFQPRPSEKMLHLDLCRRGSNSSQWPPFEGGKQVWSHAHIPGLALGLCQLLSQTEEGLYKWYMLYLDTATYIDFVVVWHLFKGGIYYSISTWQYFCKVVALRKPMEKRA